MNVYYIYYICYMQLLKVLVLVFKVIMTWVYISSTYESKYATSSEAVVIPYGTILWFYIDRRNVTQHIAIHAKTFQIASLTVIKRYAG